MVGGGGAGNLPRLNSLVVVVVEMIVALIVSIVVLLCYPTLSC